MLPFHSLDSIQRVLQTLICSVFHWRSSCWILSWCAFDSWRGSVSAETPRHWPVTGVNVELEAEEHQKETKPESQEFANDQRTQIHNWNRPPQKKNEERHDLPGWQQLISLIENPLVGKPQLLKLSARWHKDLETWVLVDHQDSMSIRRIPAQITKDGVVLNCPQASGRSFQEQSHL